MRCKGSEVSSKLKYLDPVSRRRGFHHTGMSLKTLRHVGQGLRGDCGSTLWKEDLANWQRRQQGRPQRRVLCKAISTIRSAYMVKDSRFTERLSLWLQIFATPHQVFRQPCYYDIGCCCSQVCFGDQLQPDMFLQAPSVVQNTRGSRRTTKQYQDLTRCFQRSA